MTDRDEDKKEQTLPGRPFLSVLFACCSVYQRIYRNAEGTEYSGRCPRCGKRVTFAVGPGGTDTRQFVVY
jgi:hypothetical protein